MYTKKDQLLDVVGSEETLSEISNILKKHNINTEAYAKVFAVLNYQIPVTNDKLEYFPANKEWRRGKKSMTDAKLLGLLNETCDFIRLFVEVSWEESLFSAWITDKPLKQAEKNMDEMESLGALQAIINLAAESMVSSDSSARVQWENEDHNPESNET